MNKGKWKVEEEQARLGKINSKDCLRRKYRLSRDGGKITLPERGRYLVLLDLL
jgi:6-phosphogluconolactonase (cycloisomerase 2 family)